VVGFAGVIEGFYGPPWSWDDRIAVCQFCARHGADTYLYAPKSDPLHREQWREPYATAMLDEFARLVADGGVRVGFAVSPGLSMQMDDADDRAALLAKFADLRAAGVDLFCLALDDIPAGPDSARGQGELCSWLADALSPTRLLFVPTDYTSCTPNPYLDALATFVPPDVAIGWTGPTVVADRIMAADARGRADALGGRTPWLWDNYPVNDGIMTERLFMGPLTGREPGLAELLDGYLANPMLQARASQLPLASAMAWCRSGDAQATWERVADELGWTEFARACSEEYLASLDGAAVRDFLVAAAACSAPGIDDEVEPWLRQIRREAKCALRMIDADASGNIEQLLMALASWTQLPDTKVPDPRVSVFGPRRSLRPVLAQNAALEFVLRSGSLRYGTNAIDDLIVTLAESAGSSQPRPK
jgi:hyaluronoglucosaminidase